MKGLRKGQIVMMWLWIVVCAGMTWAAAGIFPYMYLINIVLIPLRKCWLMRPLIWIIGGMLKGRWCAKRGIRRFSKYALVLSDSDDPRLVQYDMLVAGIIALLSYFMMRSNTEVLQWVLIFSFDIIILYIGINYVDKKWFGNKKEQERKAYKTSTKRVSATASTSKKKYKTKKKK